MKQKTVTLSQLQSFAPDFSALKAQLGKFNFFRSIRMQTMETRHSNALAFLLDRTETHKLGNAFEQAFFSAVLTKVGNEIALRMNQSEAQVKLAFLNEDFRVEREHTFIDHNGQERFIDLLLVSKDIVVCIENKTTSFQHDNQLEAYEKYVLSLHEHEKKEKIFLYLTPTKEIIEGSQWIKISYECVLQALDETLKLQSLDYEVKIYLTHYQDIIRRDIMNDDPIIRQYCADLYHADKEVYQTIFKYMIGSEKEKLTNAIVEKLEALKNAGEIELIVSSSKKNHTEFKFVTKSLLDMFPYEESQKETRVWRSPSRIVYEIVVANSDGFPDKISFWAVLVTGDNAIDNQLTPQIINVCNDHRQKFHLGKNPINRTEAQKHNKLYTKIYSRGKNLSVADPITDEFLRKLENDIDGFISGLQNNLECVLKNEMNGTSLSGVSAQA